MSIYSESSHLNPHKLDEINHNSYLHSIINLFVTINTGKDDVTSETGPISRHQTDNVTTIPVTVTDAACFWCCCEQGQKRNKLWCCIKKNICTLLEEIFVYNSYMLIVRLLKNLVTLLSTVHTPLIPVCKSWSQSSGQ